MFWTPYLPRRNFHELLFPDHVIYPKLAYKLVVLQIIAGQLALPAAASHTVLFTAWSRLDTPYLLVRRMHVSHAPHVVANRIGSSRLGSKHLPGRQMT